MVVKDFVRTRLRGTSDRITLYEIERLNPETDAELNQRQTRQSERFAGRDWIRILAEDELAADERRILEFQNCDVVVHRAKDGFVAFNNACPHLRLPFYDRREPTPEQRAQIPPGSSRVIDGAEVICRWHESSYDLQTGEIRTWCPLLHEDGSAPGHEYAGDVSKNRAPLEVYPCRVADGYLWISME